MKKVGIVTLTGYSNYGNRLQNYALQEVIKGFGFDVETIKIGNLNEKTNISSSFRKRVINKMSEEPLSAIARNVKTKLWNTLHKEQIRISNAQRIEAFIRFSEQYITEKEYTVSNDNISKELNEKFQFFVTGSDQVWNPNFPSVSSIHFLTFASPHKRVAFSPSFGISKIPHEHVTNFKNWLGAMASISVREEEGAKIVKDLTGREVPVLIDPTLMLKKDEWMNIARVAPNKPKGNYLLTYFLGGIPSQYRHQIYTLAKERQLEIVNLGDIRNIDTYKADPSEFIDYINSCSVFCTDSFHGAAFSILLEKPFVVYGRVGGASMSSRINTLLNKFDLHSRRIEEVKTINDAYDIDYSHIPAILKHERQKAINYLIQALDVRAQK